MTKARDIADLLDANGDVVSSALDNVPPSNDASALTTGTIDNARISLDANEIPNLDANKITSGSLGADRIPNLDTSKITTGTFSDARIPSLDTAKITTGTFADARIPSLDTSKITSGTFSDARMPSTVLNSNVDLTNLSASNLTSGTLPDARFPATLPAISGANLTNLPGGNNTPAFRAEQTIDRSITEYVATKIQCNNVTIYNTFNVGSAYSTTNFRFTPPAGKYLLGGGTSIYCQGNPISSVRLMIRRNGADLYPVHEMKLVGDQPFLSTCAMDIANGTDYYELWTFFIANPPLSVGSNGVIYSSSFWGFKIIE